MIVDWLRRATRDRHSQIDYIAKDNPLAAVSQIDRIDHQLDMLIEHPEMGRAGRQPGTRELVIGRTPFIVIYRLHGERIEVLRLLHGAQRWP